MIVVFVNKYEDGIEQSDSSLMVKPRAKSSADKAFVKQHSQL